MACDTKYSFAGQTIAQRAEEVRRATDRLSELLSNGAVKVRVDKRTGGVVFVGWEERNGITDACALRRIKAKGSATARMKIAESERAAGRTIDERAVAAGLHSHDGGETWHRGH